MAKYNGTNIWSSLRAQKLFRRKCTANVSKGCNSLLLVFVVVVVVVTVAIHEYMASNWIPFVCQDIFSFMFLVVLSTIALYLVGCRIFRCSLILMRKMKTNNYYTQMQWLQMPKQKCLMLRLNRHFEHQSHKFVYRNDFPLFQAFIPYGFNELESLRIHVANPCQIKLLCFVKFNWFALHLCIAATFIYSMNTNLWKTCHVNTPKYC